MNVPFIWGMTDMKWSWNLWHKDKPVRINIGWRRKYKRRNINCRRKRYWRKRKWRKDKVDGKGSRKTRFNRRSSMFSYIRLRKRKQCFRPKIGGETLVTTKALSEISKDQIRYMTMCERVLCDIVPINSCHLLLRWAWLNFKTLNLDERSRYLRHEGHEMNFKFMTWGQASKYQHRLKEKIEKKKYKLQKEGKLMKKERK